jgi:hypothetical protein
MTGMCPPFSVMVGTLFRLMTGMCPPFSVMVGTLFNGRWHATQEGGEDGL